MPIQEQNDLLAYSRGYGEVGHSGHSASGNDSSSSVWIAAYALKNGDWQGDWHWPHFLLLGMSGLVLLMVLIFATLGTVCCNAKKSLNQVHPARLRSIVLEDHDFGDSGGDGEYVPHQWETTVEAAASGAPARKGSKRWNKEEQEQQHTGAWYGLEGQVAAYPQPVPPQPQVPFTLAQDENENTDENLEDDDSLLGSRNF